MTDFGDSVTILVYTFPRPGGEAAAFSGIAAAVDRTWSKVGRLKTVVVASHRFDALDGFAAQNPNVEVQIEPTLVPGDIRTMSMDCIKRLHTRFSTPYVLIVQDDGYPLKSNLGDFVGKADFWGAPIISDGWKRKFFYALGFGSFNGGFSLRSHRLCEYASRMWFSFFSKFMKETSRFLGEDFYYTTLLKLLPATWWKFRFPTEDEAWRFAVDRLGGKVTPPKGVDPFGRHGRMPEMTTSRMSRHILLVRLDSIGDWILFRNTLRALRNSRRYAGTHWTMVGNPVWRGFAETFDRDLADEWIWVENRGDLSRKSYENLLPRAVWHRRVARAQSRLRERLLAGRFDEVLSLQPIRDPLLDELVSGLAPSVVGVRAEGIDSSMYTRLLDPGPEPFVFLRNRSLVSDLTGEPCEIPLSFDIPDPPPRTNRVLLFTGASHWTRRWPQRRWRQLARLLPPGLEAVEAPRHLPFSEFVRLVASCKAVVSNDTMALHLAAALGVPTVGIANGISGRGGFWPYPASLGKRVAVVGTELRHAPPRFLPSLVASQLAQARNLAEVKPEDAMSALQALLP